MLDINKFHSEKLAINVSAAITLPDNYNIVDTTYKAIYVLSLTNIFIGTDKYQKIANEKNIAIISIFPSLNIKKNEMLYDSFESQYDYSYLYQEFIISTIIPALLVKYRLSKDLSDKFLLGQDSTSLCALTMSLDNPNTFGTSISLNLNLDNIYKRFLSYLKSKFNPNQAFIISMDDTAKLNEIKKLMTDFGIISFKETNAKDISEI